MVAYSVGLSVWISLTDRILGEPGRSIWSRNFLGLLQDSLFRQTVWNFVVYTVSSVVPKTKPGVGAFIRFLMFCRLFSVVNSTHFGLSLPSQFLPDSRVDDDDVWPPGLPCFFSRREGGHGGQRSR